MTYTTTGTADPKQVAGGVLAPQSADYAGLTTADLVKRVKHTVGEPMNTMAGEMRAGDGTTSPQTTDQYILVLLNDAKNRLCRQGWAFIKQATQIVPAGNRKIPYSSLATTDGSVIRAALHVEWLATGGSVPTVLMHASRTDHDLNIWRSQGAAPAAPVYWADDGSDGFKVYSETCTAPATDGTVTVRGLATAPDLVASDDYPGWLSPHAAIYLVHEAAAMLCRRNLNYPQFAERVGAWEAIAQQEQALILAETSAADRTLARAHFAPLTVGGK